MLTKSILLVEDNPDDRELMKLAFSQGKIPHNLIVLSDGIEALDYLQKQAERAESLETVRDNLTTTMPALVMLDLNLPKINGIEILTNSCRFAH